VTVAGLLGQHADALDPVEKSLAALLAQRVAQQAPQQPDIIAQRRMRIVRVHGKHPVAESGEAGR
jgi:hypothetical protein